MRVPVELLLEKIAKFPANYAEGVEITQHGKTTTAVVQSWSLLEGQTYTVSLRRHPEDTGEMDAVLLEGVCECPSSKACKHMAQVYAIARKITPEMAEEMIKDAPGQPSGQSLDELREDVHKAVDTLIDAVIEQAKTKKI